jgi:hypothetical protein
VSPTTPAPTPNGTVPAPISPSVRPSALPSN